MRVLAILTIDGTKETRIEGDSPFMAGEPGDDLEQKGLGVWLGDWRDSLQKAEGVTTEVGSSCPGHHAFTSRPGR